MIDRRIERLVGTPLYLGEPRNSNKGAIIQSTLELAEILTGEHGLQKIHAAYDALSWMLDNTKDDGTVPHTSVAYLLQLLNEQLAARLREIEALDIRKPDSTESGF